MEDSIKDSIKEIKKHVTVKWMRCVLGEEKVKKNNEI